MVFCYGNGGGRGNGDIFVGWIKKNIKWYIGINDGSGIKLI